MPVIAAPARRPDEHRLRGIALRSLAVLCFALMAAAIKRAAEHGAGTADMLFYRNLFSLPIIVGWVAIGPGFGSLRTRRPGAHAARSAIGLTSMVLNFGAIVLLPLAEATTIGFSAPLFATILSALLLGERVGRRRWSAVGVGFLGVLIVMRPGGTLPAASLALGIAAALGVACVTLTLRQVGTTEAATTTVFWFTMVSLAVTSALLPWLGAVRLADAWLPLAVIGVTGGIAQIAMTASLRFAPIAVLAPFDYLQLIWAILIGWWLWHDLPTATTLAGGALITASGIWTVWREHRLHRERIAATPPAL